MLTAIFSTLMKKLSTYTFIFITWFIEYEFVFYSFCLMVISYFLFVFILLHLLGFILGSPTRIHSNSATIDATIDPGHHF